MSIFVGFAQCFSILFLCHVCVFLVSIKRSFMCICCSVGLSPDLSISTLLLGFIESRLVMEVSSFGDVEAEVRGQAMKAARTTACLNNIKWNNRYIGIEVKSRIYKSAIRPILTYTAETRPETSKTRQILEATEIKVVRKIAGKTHKSGKERDHQKDVWY